MESERVRAKNFGQNEINLLINLVRKESSVIECKKSGVVTLKQKSESWAELAEEFNSLSGCLPRTVKVLKDKWANIKKTAVRNYSNDKKYRRGTGGGPSRKSEATTEDAIVSDILGDRMCCFF